MEDINFKDLEKWIEAYNMYKQPKRKRQVLNLIFMNCTPLVNILSHGLARRSSDPIEDIIQVANIGLLKALKRYKPEYKNLKTFLSYSIIGEIKHYLRDKISLMKPPREILELSYRINKLSIEDLEKAGENYSKSQITKNLNISKDKLVEVINIDRRNPLSINELLFDGESKDTYESLISEKEQKEDDEEEFKFSTDEYKKALNEAIEKLPAKLKTIIKGIYFENLLQIDLAKKLNTSQSNISRMQKRAIKMLFNTITEQENKG